MYGFTRSTPLDRCYRFASEIVIAQQDEGASVWKFPFGKSPRFVGTVIRGVVIKPLKD